MTSLSIRNLVKITTTIQNQMTLSKIQEASSSQDRFQTFKESLSEAIKAAYESADRFMRNKGINPSDLGICSRRAYQWMSYLEKGKNLDAHLDGLQRINLYLPMIKPGKRFSNTRVDFSFYHQGPLYKMNGNSQKIKIDAQEVLCQAPDRVLTGILKSVLDNKAPEDKELIQEYTFSSAYREAREGLEYIGIEKGSLAPGAFFDLRNSFQRVNQTYFDGNLPEPHLIWSSRLTRRKFGHYQWDIDTVMVSKTLDQENTPAYVIDYVMFHELLHKKIGARLVNQRRAVHTPAFKKQESRFKMIDQSKRWLNQLSRSKK